MEKARDDLFAGAGLALKKDGCVRRCDLLDALDDVAEARPSTDDGQFIMLNRPSIKLDGLARLR